MKKIVITAAITTAFLISLAPATAQKAKVEKTKAESTWQDNRDHNKVRSSPNAIVGQQVGSLEIVVTYGRPGVKGRKIFGGLLPYGKVWRTGADEATTLKFSQDVHFGGKKVDAGSYSLFTIPGEKSWTVILNKEADQWGSYEYDAAQDVARVEVKPKAVPNEERLTFEFTNLEPKSSAADLVLRWATTEVVVPIR